MQEIDRDESIPVDWPKDARRDSFAGETEGSTVGAAGRRSNDGERRFRENLGAQAWLNEPCAQRAAQLRRWALFRCGLPRQRVLEPLLNLPHSDAAKRKNAQASDEDYRTGRRLRHGVSRGDGQGFGSAQLPLPCEQVAAVDVAVALGVALHLQG